MRQTGHHFVYGTLRDYLTGEELPDTDDERFRQRLARLLVEEKGFAKEELEPRLTIETLFGTTFVRSVIDLTVSVGSQRLFVLRYGPGYLVTREKPALAADRLINSTCCLPLAILLQDGNHCLRQLRAMAVLRCFKAAEPSMREVLIPLHEKFQQKFPALFL